MFQRKKGRKAAQVEAPEPSTLPKSSEGSTSLETSDTPISYEDAIAKELSDLSILWGDRFARLFDPERLRRESMGILQSCAQQLSGRLGQVKLISKKGHAELWGLCPFHDDHTVGSFSVRLDVGTFYCFVCGAKGGFKKLLTHLGLWDDEVAAHLTPEVLSALAQIARETQQQNKIEDLPELPREKLHYLTRYRPLRYLAKGHPASVLDNLHVSFDPAFNRVCFPVFGSGQQWVGVQSRQSFDQAYGLRWKWYTWELESHGIIPPETQGEAYSPPRRTVLYNEHHILPALSQGRLEQVLLLEGPGGVLRAISAGIPTLGTFGTVLGPGQQARLVAALERCAVVTRRRPTVILAPDGDVPGVSAALDTYHKLTPVADIRFLKLPWGEDAEDQTIPALHRLHQSPKTLLEVLEQRPLDPWTEALESSCHTDLMKKYAIHQKKERWEAFQRRTELQHGRYAQARRT